MSSGTRMRVARRTAGYVLAGAFLTATVSAVAQADEDKGGMSPEVAAKTQVETIGFVFKSIPVDKQSAESGAGHSVSLGGHAATLLGQEIQVGDKLREEVGQPGRVRILSIVPAIKTPTCEQQTHYLSEKSGDLSEQVQLVTISVDTAEVQKEFARHAEIENVTFVSGAAGAAFGRAHGLLIEKPPILARAVLVVDADDVVRYIQVVPNVSHMPDMDAAFEFARGLADAQPAG